MTVKTNNKYNTSPCISEKLMISLDVIYLASLSHHDGLLLHECIILSSGYEVKCYEVFRPGGTRILAADMQKIDKTDSRLAA